MCGRARQTFDWFHLKTNFRGLFGRLGDADDDPSDEEEDDGDDEPGGNRRKRRKAFKEDGKQKPNWNAAPGTYLVIVRRDKDGKLQVLRMEWGFIPAWEKDPNGGRKPINAKIETIEESFRIGKGMWRDPFKNRRCIFPVNGFYEWQIVPGQKRKQPWKIDMADDSLMPLAAVWDRWKHPQTGEEVLSFAVITCVPNMKMAAIHDRMPVILAPEDQEAWLTGSVEFAMAMCKPCPDEWIDIKKVSSRVGDERNNDAMLIDPPPVGLF